MTWQRFLNYLHYKRNKIIAIAFSSLAIATFLLCYIFCEIAHDWSYFRSKPLQIINFLIGLLTYSSILYCNIKNSNQAYRGILIFISYITFRAIIDFFDRSLTAMMYDYGEKWQGLLVDGLYVAFLIANIVVGSFLYIYIGRYLRGIEVPWGRIRGLAIAHSGILLAWAALALYVFISVTIYSYYFNFGNLMILAGESISEFFMSLGIIFTLERLRRI